MFLLTLGSMSASTGRYIRSDELLRFLMLTMSTAEPGLVHVLRDTFGLKRSLTNRQVGFCSMTHRKLSWGPSSFPLQTERECSTMETYRMLVISSRFKKIVIVSLASLPIGLCTETSRVVKRGKVS